MHYDFSTEIYRNMLKSRQALLDQLDSIAMLNPLEDNETSLQNNLVSDRRDYDDDTDTEFSDTSRGSGLFNDNLSIGTTDTKIMDIGPGTSYATKALPQLPKHAYHDHAKFQEQLGIGLSNTKNMANVLECMEDLIAQENKMIETELANIIREIEENIPNNTYSVPATNMFPMRSKRR